jgi:hypothetical protein
MLARRLQRHSTPLAARMENPVRVRLYLPPAPGSGAALCRWLRASSRRYHRPTGQPKRHERTRNWIKLGGKVTPNLLSQLIGVREMASEIVMDLTVDTRHMFDR